MRTLTKRILSMALAFCLCLTLLPNMIMKADAVDSISLMVSYAQERVGKTGQELGYNDQWCAFLCLTVLFMLVKQKQFPIMEAHIICILLL